MALKAMLARPGLSLSDALMSPWPHGGDISPLDPTPTILRQAAYGYCSRKVDGDFDSWSDGQDRDDVLYKVAQTIACLEGK